MNISLTPPYISSQETKATWYATSGTWLYRKAITIDNTKVAGSSDLINFPMLVNLSADAGLQAGALANGDDILFTSSNGTTKLSHEIEKYVTGTGELQAWVKIPTLSYNSDTIIYMYYGNALATNQQDAINVWDANNKMVQNMSEDPTGTMQDSTSNNNDGTSSGTMTSGDQVAGQIDGSIDFDGVDDKITVADSATLDITDAITFSSWVNVSGTGFTALVDDALTTGQFSHKKEITITANGTSTPANYQVKVTVAHANGIMQASFEDIRFNTKAGGYIDYWIESHTDNTTADIWLELPDAITDPGSDTINMFYGNNGLSDGKEGYDTFEFFDDFGVGEGITNPWERYAGNPIFSKNTVIANAWDSVFVNSPYIAINSDGTPYKDGDNNYYMYYSGGGHVNGVSVDKDQIGLALSTDLYNWTRIPSLGTPGDYNEGLTLPLGAGGTWDDEDTQIGAIIVRNSTFHMWYTGNSNIPDNTHIGYASSSDGKTWTKYVSNPVIGNGAGDDDDDLYAPTVILDGSTWKMWYIGQRTAGSPNFGVMYATAPVAEPWNWTKHSANWVYEYAGGNMWGPYVYKESGVYYMLFANYNAQPYETYYATSLDGISWTYQGKIFEVDSGEWDEAGLLWVSQIQVDGTWYTYYRGNNNAFTQIQIGVTTSSNRLPTPAPAGSLDVSKWVNTGSIGVSFDSGVIELNGFGSAPFKGLLTHASYGNFDNFICEARARIAGAAAVDEVAVLPRMTDVTASQDSYYMSWYHTVARTLARFINGAYTSLDSDASPPTGWFNLKCILNGNSLKMYQNGVEILSATDASHSTGKIGLGGGGSGRTGQYDWFFVRKFIVNEPLTPTFGAEVSAASQAVITKDNSYSLGASTTTAYAGINNQIISSAISAGWNHIALTYDRLAEGSEDMKLYINGTEATTGDYSTVIATNTNNVLLGNTFNGTIDDVRISATARSADWILTEYNNQKLPATFYILGSAEASNTAPTATAPTASQVADGTGYVTIQTTIDDVDDDTAKFQVEYSLDGGSTWTSGDPILTSYITTSPDQATEPDIDNAETYQVGMPTNKILTSAGANTVTIKWDTKSVSNGTSAITYQNNIKLRITPNDGTIDGTPVVSASAFTIDNIAPTVALTYSEDPSNAGAMTITATYSEAIVGTPNISIDQQGTTDISSVAMSGGTTVWTYAYTVVATNGSTYVDGTATVNLSTVTDTALNNSTSPTNTTFTIDTTAPTGTTLGFGTITTTSIQASVSGASDLGSGLHATPYYFDNTIVPTSSGYQTGTTWDSTPLSINTQYTFRVRSKDVLDNESAYTATQDRYTLANVPTSLSLTSDSTTQITANWNANSNPAGTEYYIENTTAGTNSGWIISTLWISSNLTCATSYSFKVKSRNGDTTATAFTSMASIETQSCEGGGGLPPVAYNPPAPPESTPENPESNFGVVINNNNEYTNSEIVELRFNTGADTIRMAVSNYSDFGGASQVLYQKEISWNLSDCNTPPAPSQEGNICVVYAKFYTRYGVSSEVVSDSIILKTAVTETETEEQLDDSDKEEPVSKTEDDKSSESLEDSGSDKDIIAEDNKSSSFIFTKNLKLGSYETEVIQLQNKLKELNFFPQEIKSNDYFGLATEKAVEEYQTSKEIYPCGIVGPRTRKALNNEEFITNKDYKFTQDLKYNDKNEEVKQLQTRLRDQNFFPYYLQSSGWFGPTTQKAVNIFQKFYNLIQSGVVDKGMREVLNR